MVMQKSNWSLKHQELNQTATIEKNGWFEVTFKLEVTDVNFWIIVNHLDVSLEKTVELPSYN